MKVMDVWQYRENTWGDSTSRGSASRRSTARSARSTTATRRRRRAAIVVDTGPWIFGKKVMLPAGVIDRVDFDDEKVFVNRTKDEIKNAPEYDDALSTTTAYRGELGTYYGPGGAGYRDWDRPGL